MFLFIFLSFPSYVNLYFLIFTLSNTSYLVIGDTFFFKVCFHYFKLCVCVCLCVDVCTWMLESLKASGVTSAWHWHCKPPNVLGTTIGSSQEKGFTLLNL